MKCQDFRKMISRTLDGAVERAKHEDLERHLASCSGCRAFQEVCLTGFSMHRSVQEADPPPSLLPSILAVVAVRSRGGWVRGSFRFGLPAAAAAAALLGFWIGGLMHESYGPESAENHADVLELKYLDEYPPGSFGDILTASYQGGGDEQR